MSSRKEQPLVSVVIPVYNGANFLAEAIESALNQTYRNIEIIVVNDGSRDSGATREVAQSFGDRIRYFEKENGGCGSAFNYGINRMQGEYFSWLSHDDLYDRTKIERQLEVLSHREETAHVACCAYRLLDESTNKIIPQPYYDVEEFERKPLYGLFRGAINGNCLLISKKVFDKIGLFDEALRTTQDYDLFYRMLQRFTIAYHDDVLVTARMHPQQDTLAKYDLAMQESDRLWTRFIGESESIGTFEYEKSAAEYWAKFANHLWCSPYPAARERVFAELRRSLDAQVPRPGCQPLVSVIIPFVRADTLLMSAVKSAIEQTYRNLEIILSANARIKHEELQEVEYLANANGRSLRVIDASAKRGASFARNRGLDAAQGELIALLDADDFWHPKKIDLQVAAMLGINCEAVSTAYSENGLDLDNFEHKQKLYYSSREYLLTLDRIFPTPSFMFRATDLRFDESMHICEDMDFFSKLIGNGCFLNLPFRLSIINVKSAYAWKVADAYAARMGVCMSRGVAQRGDVFETTLFLTMCHVAISRGTPSDLHFIVRNLGRVLSAMPRKFVVEKFARHLARSIPGARKPAAWALRASRSLRASWLQLTPSGLTRSAYRRVRRITYRALVPGPLERRIVAYSPTHRDTVARLHSHIAEHQTVSITQSERIARLEQVVAEQKAREAADHERQTDNIKQIALLEHSAAEQKAAYSAQVEKTGELERLLAQYQVTDRANIEQIARLEETIVKHQTAYADSIAQTGRLEEILNETQAIQTSQNEEIARLEKSIVESQAACESHVEHIRRLEQLVTDKQSELKRVVQECSAALDENSALKGQVAAFRIANDNQAALITGKLSLLEYQLKSFRAPGPTPGSRGRDANAYLDLLERSLVGVLNEDPSSSPWSKGEYDADLRAIGRDWPQNALTMVGTVRMRNLRYLLERALEESIPGDVLEAGVWRGGACIYMRGILASHGITDRRVWVADSFRGLPPPDEAIFPADHGDIHHTFEQLAVPLEEVKRNFDRYGLLDDQVCFLEGWFKDTLPTAPLDQLALLRLDGDMYESTIQALDALYSKVSIGGFVIVDDFILEPCRRAIEDFRTKHGITEPLQPVDGAAVFWRKTTIPLKMTPGPRSSLRTEETLA